MNPPRKVAVVTGTRADYGLLYWIIQDIHEDEELELQLLVTGMHLLQEFGHTVDQIETDGWPISATVDMQLTSDSPRNIGRSMGLGTMGFAESFDNLRPDILVLLGDRFETLSAAQAAVVARIPIAHIHGGEVTEGAIDESIRHAITKLASLHFVSAAPHARRVIQMGEQPDKVFNVGAPGLDNIQRLALLGREALARELHFALEAPLFLVTYHSATLDSMKPAEAVNELCTALECFPVARIIWTYPNADTGGREVLRRIRKFAKDHARRTLAVPSLGQVRYLSAMQHADVIIGNSSSGIIEAPSFHKPTVNIGPRQKGRLRAASVVDCAQDSSSIAGAINIALSEPFQSSLAEVSNPYGQADASLAIVSQLKKTDLSRLTTKPFHDIAY